jgi:hypothetical protein
VDRVTGHRLKESKAVVTGQINPLLRSMNSEDIETSVWE